MKSYRILENIIPIASEESIILGDTPKWCALIGITYIRKRDDGMCGIIVFSDFVNNNNPPLVRIEDSNESKKGESKKNFDGYIVEANRGWRCLAPSAKDIPPGRYLIPRNEISENRNDAFLAFRKRYATLVINTKTKCSTVYLEPEARRKSGMSVNDARSLMFALSELCEILRKIEAKFYNDTMQ